MEKNGIIIKNQKWFKFNGHVVWYNVPLFGDWCKANQLPQNESSKFVFKKFKKEQPVIATMIQYLIDGEYEKAFNLLEPIVNKDRKLFNH